MEKHISVASPLTSPSFHSYGTQLSASSFAAVDHILFLKSLIDPLPSFSSSSRT
jgi:hypothetical protein